MTEQLISLNVDRRELLLLLLFSKTCVVFVRQCCRVEHFSEHRTYYVGLQQRSSSQWILLIARTECIRLYLENFTLPSLPYGSNRTGDRNHRTCLLLYRCTGNSPHSIFVNAFSRETTVKVRAMDANFLRYGKTAFT